MNIDERLEALTQSVELLAVMHKDSEKTYKNNEKLASDMIRKIGERVGALGESMELLASIHRDNEKLAGEMMLAIVRLSRIAEAHNGQLEDTRTGSTNLRVAVERP